MVAIGSIRFILGYGRIYVMVHIVEVVAVRLRGFFDGYWNGVALTLSSGATLGKVDEC